MPNLSTFSGDSTFRDGVVNMAGATAVVLPANTVGDAGVTAASPLNTTKTRRRFNKGYAQNVGAAAASVTGVVVHVVYGAVGTVIAVRAGVVVAAVGAATVTIDIKKNGTTILTAVITLDVANTIYIVEAGSVSVSGLVAGDVLTAVLVATAGGGTLPQGVFVDVVIDEDPS